MNILRQKGDQVLKRIESFLNDIEVAGFDYKLCDVLVFGGGPKGDAFLGGKLINAFSYALVANPNRWLDSFPKFLDLALARPLETWGMLNFCLGLDRIRRHGLWETLIDEETCQELRRVLDWRHFVNVADLSLINKPTNYYGVAFAIAKYRELFGFEEAGFGEQLLAKLIDHVEEYSGDMAFMDETTGQGRYDRYSCLIPGELACHFLAFDIEIDERIKVMLQKSVDIYLRLVNPDGHGFVYGRSIGVYGDTSALEVLSIASRLGLLDDHQRLRALAYASRIIDKYLNFWSDPEFGGINMWWKGRRTDGYRRVQRILGENFSTSCQILASLDHFGDHTGPTPNQEEKLCAIERGVNFYRFSVDPPRAMAVIGFAGSVWQLPLVNGGRDYYDATPYFPVPQSPARIEMLPDVSLPLMWPFFKIREDLVVAPLANYQSINFDNDCVQFTIDSFVVVEAADRPRDPVSLPGYQAVARYRFGDDFIDFTLDYLGEQFEALTLLCPVYQQATRTGVSVATSWGVIEFQGLEYQGLVEVTDRHTTNHGRCLSLYQFGAGGDRQKRIGYRINLSGTTKKGS